MKQVLKIIILFAILIVFGTFSMLIDSCEPSLPLQIENHTNLSLTVYVQNVEAGNLTPGDIIKVKNISGTLSYILIEAKNVQGDIIFSKNFSTSELYDDGWKVVISPKQ